MSTDVAKDAALQASASKLAAHQARNAPIDDATRRLPTQNLDWKFLTPLFWAPTFPFIRHSTKHLQPGTRNTFLGIAILIANFHGFWLINNPDLSDEALGITR